MLKSLKSLLVKYSSHKASIYIAIASFFLGSVLSPLITDLVSTAVNHFFQRVSQKEKIISEIEVTTNNIHTSASRVNYLTIKLAKLVCRNIYHKKYDNIPCYDLSPNKKIIALVGQPYIDNMDNYIRTYESNVNKLVNILLKNKQQYPDFKNLSIIFQNWLSKIDNNCRFPTEAYYAWEKLFIYGVDKDQRIHKQLLLEPINRAVDLGKGGYPRNCKNYPKS